MSPEKTMRAVVLQDDRTVKVEYRAIPLPGPTEIQLKVVAVGQNPTDWKHAEKLSSPGSIMGCDFVGEVVSTGEQVPHYETSPEPREPSKQGDVVRRGELRWGFFRGGFISPKTGKQRGAFAEYLTIDWDLTGVVPKNISAEQAASIPIPYATAVQALYLRLRLPEYPAKSSKGEWILIWSGATSVGQYAIQLAKLAGLRVATTASEKKWELVKNLGADAVVDYKDPNVVEKLKEATGDEIQYGLDCISEHGSIQKAEAAFRPSGGHLVTILFDHRGTVRSEVKKEATLAYTALGEDHGFGRHPNSQFKTSEEDRGLYTRWCKLSYELFGSGQIKPLPIDVLGGLDDVQKGFELMKSGKHSGKIVYRV